MSNYVTFKKFPDAVQAKALQQFLIDSGVECLFADTSPAMGSAMAGDYNKEYEVQLKPADFEKAEQLLEDHAKTMLNNLPDDYYLLSFSNEELFDVVLKHDEWSEFDYLLARKLLAERGKEVDEDLIKSLRNQRIFDLAKPEQDQTVWIIVGYGLAFIGGLLGIITGYVLWSSKKTLPNGQVVPTYSQSDRAHGKLILILGIVMVPILITIRLLMQ